MRDLRHGTRRLRNASGCRPHLTLAVLFLVLSLCLPASALTPFYLQTHNADGTPQTNIVTFTPYPPGAPFYVNGTNVVFGALPVNFTPTNTTGFLSNNLEPITYTVTYSNAPNLGFFVTIADTTNYLPLTTYMTQTPVVSASYGSSFGFFTNQLGYWPATNSYAGIAAALQYSPATNTFAGIAAALQYVPATNTQAGIIAALQYVPATNTYAGVSAALGFYPATNSYGGLIYILGFQPATNSDPRLSLSITNLTGDMFTASQAGGTTSVTLSNVVAAGTSAGRLTWDSKGRVTGTNAMVLSDLPPLSSVGTTNTATWFSVVTNGGTVWISARTNGNMGSTLTNFPPGTICLATNGGRFTLSNNFTWWPF